MPWYTERRPWPCFGVPIASRPASCRQVIRRDGWKAHFTGRLTLTTNF